MRITSALLHLVELPLVRPFRTSYGTESVRQAIVVELSGPETEGFGECAAESAPLYSPEFTATAWAVLTELLLPRLLASPELAPEEVQQLFGPVKGHRMAKSAVEMAVLDGELRQKGLSLKEYLGGISEQIRPGVSVGISEIPELLELVSSYRAEGYCRVKLKVAPGNDIEPTAAVRALLGDDFALQVDANCAYERSDAAHLSSFDELGLLLIEQPLDEDDLLGHAALAESLATPICLDESLVSPRVTRNAIEMGACSVVNVKPARLGGYLAAKKVHDICVAAGAPAWCGGMLETGIGRAANLALASLPGFTLPPDLSATERYFKNDVTAPFVMTNGAIAVPNGPGIGVEVDRSALRALSTRHWSSR